MKCPNNESLLLYVDELASDKKTDVGNLHIEEFKKHLETCKICSKRIAEISIDERVIREEFDVFYTKHSQAKAIMEKVRRLPVATKNVGNIFSGYTFSGYKMWLKMLIPAVSLIALIAVIILSLPGEKEKIFKNVTLVSLRALNSDSYYNGSPISGMVFDKIEINALEPFCLTGNFNLSVNSDFYSELAVIGSMAVSLKPTGSINFEGTDIIMELVHGREIPLLVNGNVINFVLGEKFKVSSEKVKIPEDADSNISEIKIDFKAIEPDNVSRPPEKPSSTDGVEKATSAKLKFRLRNLPEETYVKPNENCSETEIIVSDDSINHSGRTTPTEESYRPFDGNSLELKE